MKTNVETRDGGYSPPITIELILHGEHFNVASSGPDKVILRDARITKAGKGIVRFIVDGVVTDYLVDLVDGVKPDRTHQPISILGVQGEVAA